MIQLVALQVVDNLVIQIGLRTGFSMESDEGGGDGDLVKGSPAGECGIRKATLQQMEDFLRHQAGS